MKIKKSTKIARIFKRIFKIREWLDLDRFKDATLFIIAAFKRVFIPQKKILQHTPQEKEQQKNFKNAAEKLNLSSEALSEKQTSLFRLSQIMCGFAACLIGYSIYQMFYGTFRAAIVSLVLSFLAFTLAFRYHFWYFQIKERRLGCSIREWYDSLSSARGKKQ